MSKRTKGGRVKNPPAVEVTKASMSRTTVCAFCHQGETKDILQSGRLYKLGTGKGSVEFYHYFCLLFSSQGVQRGKDEEGLNGFLLEDIKTEVKRGSGIKCDVCKKPGATIHCHVKKCKKNYHFSCGATTSPEHLFIFRNNMDSYCWSHAPQQKKISHVVSDATCMVCLDNSLHSPGPGPGRLVSPCCGRTFHRDCVQKTALQAGKVSLKCPACNTKEKFNEEMERCGIYIPHADATWEMPENSNFYQFEDMLNLYKNCDVESCQCPKGRDHTKVGTQFELIKCQTCGQSGVHVVCGNLDLKNPVYMCSTCRPSSEDDSDEDEYLRAAITKHEERRKELLDRKNQIIQQEKDRLLATKRKQDEMIQRIKDIFASSSVPENNSIKENENGLVGVSIVNKVTGELVRVKSQPEPNQTKVLNSEVRPRTAMGMPRKRDVIEDLVTQDESNNESESDDELKGVLKISAIFSAGDDRKLNTLPENCLAPAPSQTESLLAKDCQPLPSKAISECPVQQKQVIPDEDEESDCLEDVLEDRFTDEH